VMNHCEAKNPEGAASDDSPVDDDQQNARTGERGKKGDYAEVPNLVGVDRGDPRAALGERESKQHSECGQSAVSGNDDGADAKENGMHLSKNSVSGQRQGRTRPTGP